MSKLEELIKEFCPNGVEYVKIGSVVNYEQPSKYLVKKADYKEEYSTPVLTAGQTFILGYTNEMNGIYNASKDSHVIIFDDFTGAFKWVDFPFKVKSSAIKFLKANEKRAMLRYIFHVMGNINLTSTEHKRLWIGIYSELQIPLPALPVQREIVRVLDSFTLYSAELTAELTARRKQYEFYRDKLLTFSQNDFEWTILEKIAVYTNGKGHENNVNEKGKYILINSKFVSTKGEVIKFVDEQFSPIYQNEFAMVLSDLPNGRALAKCFFVLEDDRYTVNQRICKISNINEKILPKFLFYYMDRNKYFLAKDNGVDQTNLSKDYVLQMPIPVLPLAFQKRIVYVLDNFDAICSDLGIGLPAEIEKRQKQYEYYRDKLLSFQN